MSMNQPPQDDIDTINRQVLTLLSNGHFQQALELAQIAQQYAQQKYGMDSVSYADSENNLAVAYYRLGQFKEAETHYRQALEATRRSVGQNHADYATSLHNLAALVLRLGDIRYAEQLYRQASLLRKSLFGDQHPSYINSIDGLAHTLQQQKRFSEAKNLFLTVREQRYHIYGVRHQLYADALHGLANLYRDSGDFSQSEQLYKDVLAIRIELFGENYFTVANTWTAFGRLYHEMGRFKESEKVLDRAIAYWSKIHKGQHPDYATVLHNLGVLFFKMARYKDSEKYFQQALTIQRITVGIESLDYAESTNGLGLLYATIGYNYQAESLFHKALIVRKQICGTTSHKYAESLNNLAILYRRTDKLQQARSNLEEVCDIARQIYDEQHPSYITHLSNLAGVYYELEQFSEAENTWIDSLKLISTSTGDTNTLRATILRNLGVCYRTSGRIQEAEGSFNEAAVIIRDTLGQEHPDYAACLNELSSIYVTQNKLHDAFNLLEQSNDIYTSLIKDVFSFSSEDERSFYIKNILYQHDQMLSVAMFLFLEPNIANRMFNIVLKRKSILIEVISLQYAQSDWPDDIKEYLTEIIWLRQQISAQILTGSSIEKDNKNIILPWTIRKNYLEKLVSPYISVSTDEFNLHETQIKHILNVLPEGAALIEYVRYFPYDFTAVDARIHPQWLKPRYIAFVLCKDNFNDIQLIDLGETDEIDCILTSWRNTITGKKASFTSNSYTTTQDIIWAATRDLGEEQECEPRQGREEGELLRCLLIDPLCKVFQNTTQLYIAPDGALAYLPFAALPVNMDHYLIDFYDIRYISVGRDLTRSLRSNSSLGPPAVIGDPDFDLGMDERQSKKQVPFRRLQGTHQEAEKIANLLGVSPLLGTAALKQVIKSLQSPQILHIATHGYFFEARTEPTQQVSSSFVYSSRMLAIQYISNPLLRAGLALAGANTWMQGGNLPYEAEDGILTGEDVINLNLKGVILVVLSACETGLGQFEVGEGLLGLRRAFTIAGAERLIMSLWKIPDAQTQELMVNYYQRLTNGEGLAEALRQSQLDLKARYPDKPFLWGAFIFQGMSGSLPSP